MKKQELIPTRVSHGHYTSYLVGLILCICLTLIAFYIVSEKMLTGFAMDSTLVGLGLAQASVQLIVFLHLGEEPKPYWNLINFLFMLMVLLIIVMGTLWIMHSLGVRTMST